MDTVLSQERLHTIYNQSACEVAQLSTGIVLNEEDSPLNGEVCTVYTNFERNIHSGLAFCAELGLLTRLAQKMIGSEQVEFQDVEDSAKEFFNELCGHIAVALYHDTKVPARFDFPVFYRGKYEPEDRQESWSLHFLSDQKEAAELIHYNAPSDGAAVSSKEAI